METLVVDKSSLGDPELEAFFKADPENRIVLINIAELESYSGDTIKNISQALSILSRYPGQVLCQKHALELLRMGQINSDEPLSLIDQEKTRNFKRHCEKIRLAANGDVKMLAELSQVGDSANVHLDLISQDGTRFIEPLIKSVKKCMTPEALRAFRNGEECPLTDHQRSIEAIFTLGQSLLKNDHTIPQLHRVAYLARNYYKLRFAAAMWSTALLRVVDGGAPGISPRTLRNDLLDLSYVVAATYYDGIMTNDQRLTKVFTLTFGLIHVALAPPPGWPPHPIGRPNP